MALLNLRSSLYHSSIATSLHNAIFGKHVTIYTLHRPAISPHQSRGTAPEFLDNALTMLKDAGFTFVSLTEVVSALGNEKLLPPKSVCFTVDDGYADQALCLAPIFIKHNAKATFFLITDLLDKLDWPWDEKIRYIVRNTKVRRIENIEPYLSDKSFSLTSMEEKVFASRFLQNFGKTLKGREIPNFIERISQLCEVPTDAQPPAECEPMSWDTARELESQGIRFGPHSTNHYITSQLTDTESLHQFNHAWARVSDELEYALPIYCYPTGRTEDFNRANEKSLAENGYIAAVSMVSEPIKLKTGNASQYKLPRIPLPNSLNEVLRYASWFESVRNILP